MRRIDELRAELRVAIVNSDEYKEYKQLSDQLASNCDLKRAVYEFRKRNFELQHSNEVDDMLAATQALNREYADIRSQELVSRYLAAELRLCRMVQGICMDVVSCIDFDISFI